MYTTSKPSFGTPDLRLPGDLRGQLKAHLEYLRQQYMAMGWAQRVGFGQRPALIVIDLALLWTRPENPFGSNIDSVVEATNRTLTAARAAEIPIFFTTSDLGTDDPPSPHDRKMSNEFKGYGLEVLELDPRLGRRPGETILRKKYASSFKATNLHEMLTALGIDTLIVTGVSTSHCVYATCRDATDSFRVIVPAEAVGERCEIMHEVNLLDIDIDLGDVMPVGAVVTYLGELRSQT